MGNMIIKKEDLKGDITIKFSHNVSYCKENHDPMIELIDGVLKIDIRDKIIADKNIVKSIKLTDEYTNNFIAKGFRIPETTFIGEPTTEFNKKEVNELINILDWAYHEGCRNEQLIDFLTRMVKTANLDKESKQYFKYTYGIE